MKCLGDELLAAGDYRVGRNEGNESCRVRSPAFLLGRKGACRWGLDERKRVYAGCRAHAAFMASDNGSVFLLSVWSLKEGLRGFYRRSSFACPSGVPG